VFTSILDHLPTTLFLREARGGHPAGQTTRRFPKVDLFARELRQFVDACRTGAGTLNSVEDSVRLMEVLDAATPAAELS